MSYAGRKDKYKALLTDEIRRLISLDKADVKAVDRTPINSQTARNKYNEIKYLIEIHQLELRQLAAAVSHANEKIAGLAKKLNSAQRDLRYFTERDAKDRAKANGSGTSASQIAAPVRNLF